MGYVLQFVIQTSLSEGAFQMSSVFDYDPRLEILSFDDTFTRKPGKLNHQWEHYDQI
jgi:hypothetical protein